MPIQPKQLAATAFAFRGYNTTNLGRSPELLAHPAYGPIVEKHLREASQICADVAGMKVDLVQRVRDERESTLQTFGEDIALVLSMELAQLELLKELFNIDYTKVRFGLGYSLGEIAALVAGGVFQLRHVLKPLLAMAGDCAELAQDVTMGIVFSRGPALNLDAVRRLCLKINHEGRGVIGISAHLSPNTVLVLGQGDTVDRFKQQMKDSLNGNIHLRKHSGQWPPLHTPLLWQRNVPNRSALMMLTEDGGLQAPSPPVLSMVTGDASYNDYNSREILHRWLDHPQQLWDVVCRLLSEGIEVVVHVGPQPNLIPATFNRLSDNVKAQLSRSTLNGLGLRAISGIANRPWLAKVLSTRVALLRSPYVAQVILEDWLLEQNVNG